ncbi:hypothetical protein EYZ11_008111 [Aspergillus tanneri]|uniref:Ubiquitin carboxyl-terminal hydrolase n=1 Tax=Aspergillus tanneri TaxID=1220188 RepID=A0A4S3JGV2_9EURO|nr:hypothetical protein EYZ11_008111 [Aspergillus tanneri]
MAPGVEFINGKKTFIPIENNPEVLSRLAHNLGISDALTFHDIFDIQSDEALHSLPRPVNALTIGNACGLMALLHCLLNLDDGRYVTAGSKLDELRKTAVPLPPPERAQLLYDSKFLEEAHMDAAVTGSTHVPTAQDKVEGHFMAFVKDVRGKVWELNGSLPGPVERGVLVADEDLLSQNGIQMTILDFIETSKTVEGGWGISIVGLSESR